MSFSEWRRLRLRLNPVRLLLMVISIAVAPACIRAKPGAELEQRLYEKNLALPSVTAIGTRSIQLGATTHSIDACLESFTPGQRLSWTATSSNPALLPSAQISLSEVEISEECAEITLSLTPNPNTVGITTVTLSWADNYKSTTSTFRFSVVPYHEISLAEDGFRLTDLAAGYTIAGSGPVFTILEEPVSILPSGQLTLGAAGQLWYEPTPDFNGTDSLTYQIAMMSNGVAEVIQGQVEYQVIATPDSPSAISLSAISIAENNAIDASIGTLSTTDPDVEDTHTYSIVNGAGDSASFSIGGTGANELLLKVSADHETRSSYTVTVRSIDADGFALQQSFTISVHNVVEAPAISYSTGSHTLNRDVAMTSIVAALDAGRDASTSCNANPSLPSGLSLSTSCTLSGTPSLASPLTTHTITASNSAGSSQATLEITVIDSAPALSYSPTHLSTEEDVAISPWSSSTTGGDVTACASTPDLPAGLSVAASSGNCLISGTPTTPTGGTQTFTITGSNLGGSSTATLTITVTDTDPRTIFLAEDNCNNNTAVIGSRAVPFCSAQAAVSAAIAASPSAGSPVTIQVGSRSSGNFGGVVLTQSFGAHVTWKGVSTSVSRIGNVTASGADGVAGTDGWNIYDETSGMPNCNDPIAYPGTPGSPGGNGHSLTLISDGTVRFGVISASGGNGGAGASAYTDTCMSTIAGTAAGPGGNGAVITLERVTAESVMANAGNAGAHASVQNNQDWVSGRAAGLAGEISLILSTIDYGISARGADGEAPPGGSNTAGSGSPGGIISLDRSTVAGSCDASAGNDGTSSYTPDATCHSGGKILLTGSPASCGAGYHRYGSSSCSGGEGSGALCDANSNTLSIQVQSGDSTSSFTAMGSASGQYLWSTTPSNWGSFWPDPPTASAVTWNHGSDPGRRITLSISDPQCSNLVAATWSFGSNARPTLSGISTLSGGTEDTVYTITFAQLAAATSMSDLDGEPLYFAVQMIASGTLSKDGNPFSSGYFSSGELVWTPPANASGNTTAFWVSAYDGFEGSTNTAPVVVNLTPVNDAPTLTQIVPIIAPEGAASVTLTHSQLSLAANEADVDTSPLSFRIESVASGSLSKNGSAITPGSTLISSGDSVVWTPSGGASGAVTAFAVVAWDGQLASTGAVAVRLQIGSSPEDDPDALTLGEPRAIYLATSGCDNAPAAIGFSKPAFCTAQAAVNAAIAAAPSSGSPVTIQVGTGNFGSVTLTQNFGANVTWKGNGTSSSIIGNIVASGAAGENGADGYNPPIYDCSISGNFAQTGGSGGNGYNLTLNSDHTVQFGNIYTTGGPGGTGGSGAANDVTCGAYSTFSSGGSGGSGGNGGSIVLHGVSAGAVYAGGASGGSGGQHGQSYGPEYSGAGGPGGSPGSIVATNSNLTLVSSQGGSGGSTNHGASGGTITLHSTVVSGSCSVAAGSNANDSYCPVGGTISLYGASGCSSTIVNGASSSACSSFLYGGTGVVCDSNDTLAITSAGATSSSTAVVSASGGSSGWIEWSSSQSASFSQNPSSSTELTFSSAPTSDVEVYAVDGRCSHMHSDTALLGFSPPTLTTISTLSGSHPLAGYTLTYDALADAANEADTVSTVSFRIEAVLNGTLTLNGIAVIPGETILQPGAALVWTAPPGAGRVDAFRVVAWDGYRPSSTQVTVSIDVTNDIAPSSLTYSITSATYTVGSAISDNSPSSSGGTVVSYAITPDLAAQTGLSFNTSTGVISGTPTTTMNPAGEYTVTASNTGGSTTATLTIGVEAAPAPMVLVFNTTLGGNTDVTLPLSGAVSVVVDWGDGNSESISSPGNHSHTYATDGTYTVEISGALEQFGIGDGYPNAEKLTQVTSFGALGLTSLSGAFFNATNLSVVPATVPATVTDMSWMFYGATGLTSLDLSSFNTANVTNMSSMFAYATGLTSLDLSSFDTANVTDMSAMFYNATGLTSLNASGWNVGSVSSYGSIFSGTSGGFTVICNQGSDGANGLGTLFGNDCSAP